MHLQRAVTVPLHWIDDRLFDPDTGGVLKLARRLYALGQVVARGARPGKHLGEATPALAALAAPIQGLSGVSLVEL